jgi:pyruvate dehydrogenase E2 component (dihydrolipoamide acetyltransferase)
MATVVRMPSVLAGATEAALANWLVKPGDTVTVGTPLAEIETEKALVEYAAEAAGIVGRLVLAAGDNGEIGDPIAVLIAAGETDADIDAALGVSPPAPPTAPPSTTAPSPPAASSPPSPSGSIAQLGSIEGAVRAIHPVGTGPFAQSTRLGQRATAPIVGIW